MTKKNTYVAHISFVQESPMQGTTILVADNEEHVKAMLIESYAGAKDFKVIQVVDIDNVKQSFLDATGASLEAKASEAETFETTKPTVN